jgi:TonB family protein
MKSLRYYIKISAVVHALGLTGLVAASFLKPPPPQVYGIEFTGGQSGFGTGRMEPAPMPVVAPAPNGADPAAHVLEKPPVSDDVQRVAVPDVDVLKKIAEEKERKKKKKKAAEKKKKSPPHKKKGGEEGGRGDSPLGHGDTMGAKTGPVGGVGTSLEIGGFGPGSGGKKSKFPYSWYVNAIYKRLWESWDRTNAGNKECSVSFTIARNGHLKEARVSDPSGDGDYDFNAKRAVETSAPFPELPEGYREPLLKVSVRFRLQ